LKILVTFDVPRRKSRNKLAKFSVWDEVRDGNTSVRGDDQYMMISTW